MIQIYWVATHSNTALVHASVPQESSTVHNISVWKNVRQNYIEVLLSVVHYSALTLGFGLHPNVESTLLSYHTRLLVSNNHT